MSRYKGSAAFLGYIATILLANYFIKNIGVQFEENGPHLFPVWFGIYAPSGTLLAGLAFTLRDFVQDIFGKVWTIVAVLLGAGLSILISPELALASGGAFLLSELADLLVYTPIKDKTWLGAVILSNSVGLVLDSFFFITLANLPLFLLSGQIIGKIWSTLFAVLCILSYEYFLFRRTSPELVA